MNIKHDKWNAQHYKKHSQGQFDRALKIIDQLRLNGDETILDVGCGDGRITAEIAKRVPHGHLLGIDISQNMIDEAQKNFGNIENLTFQCVDLVKFSSDKKFDRAVSFATFHWIKDQEAALKNIFNVLKPGGKLNLMMAFAYESPISAVFHDKKLKPLLQQKEQIFFPQTIEGLEALLKIAGFKHGIVQLKTGTQTFASEEHLFNALFAWVPHATGLPLDKAREFTQDLINSISAASMGKELTWETKLLYAEGEK